MSTANEIASTYTDYIKDYSYELSASANSYNLETVETKGFNGRGMMGGGKSSNSRGNAPSFPGGNEMPNMKEVMQSGRENQKVELNINAEPLDYLLLFVTGYLVIILALIIPSIGIMRYQPKEILTGKE